MKAVILAGGLGTRLSEETNAKPKPMIEIGGKPILWHIMKTYSFHGINDFIICCGYKGYIIKEYFNNYFLHQSDVTFNMKENKMIVHEERAEPWTVTLVDTGDMSMTGGRLKRLKKYLSNETFLLTYGDGVSNVNLKKLINFHKKHKKMVTLTAVKPPARFGVLKIKDGNVLQFKEKSKKDLSWINGGFFVIEPKFFKYLKNDSTYLERKPLEKICELKQLSAYKHNGFWQCMDTKTDKDNLEKILIKKNKF